MPSSVPMGGGLVLRGWWGRLWVQSSAGLLELSAPFSPHLPLLSPPCPLPAPCWGLVALGKQLQSIGKAGREPSATPAGSLPCCWEEAACMVTGPAEAGGARHCLQPYGCSRGSLAQPPANPLSSASPSFLPLWCRSCLGPCSSLNSHRKLSRSDGGCAPEALMARPRLKDGTLRLYLLSAQGPPCWWDTRHKMACIRAIKLSHPPNQVAASKLPCPLLWYLS